MGIKDWVTEKLIVGFIKPIYDKLEGKKTYVIMTVGIIMSAIDVWNNLCGEQIIANWCVDVKIPTIVFTILFALGIYTRSAAKPK